MLSKGLKKICRDIKKIKTINFLFFVLGLMFMLASANYANSQNLQRTQLDAEIKITEDYSRWLSVNVSQLQSTERIENESKKLDLVKMQSKDTYYLVVKEEKVALK